MNTDLKVRLIDAVTEWDRKESTKRGYNFYAFPQYLNAVESVTERVWEGLSVSDALEAHFNDRLLSFLKKRVL